MSQQILNPQWREENRETKYPFTPASTMTSLTGQVIPVGVFVDARLYPVGGLAELRITRVLVDHERVVVYAGDTEDEARATATFSTTNEKTLAKFVDALGRPAGVIVLSDTTAISAIRAWGLGEFEFSAGSTTFVASACTPTPETGVRGFRLSDGSILTGDVWLIGSEGVVVRRELVQVKDPLTQVERQVNAIRVDVVGDPLFRRKLCATEGEDATAFRTPQLVRRIRFVDRLGQEVLVDPDSGGDIQMWANNQLSGTSVLRITPRSGALAIEAVGTTLKGVLNGG